MPGGKGPRARCGFERTKTGIPCGAHVVRYGVLARCAIHGGNLKPGTKGNKRGITTGANETIGLDTLTPSEAAYYQQSKDIETLKELDHQIRIERIREGRMLARILLLRDVEWVDWELMERNDESEEFGKSFRKDKTRHSPAQRIDAIEEAITRVKAVIVRLLAQRAAIEFKLAEKPQEAHLGMMLVDDDRDDWHALMVKRGPVD